jgi:hypothetical protein
VRYFGNPSRVGRDHDVDPPTLYSAHEFTKSWAVESWAGYIQIAKKKIELTTEESAGVF